VLEVLEVLECDMGQVRRCILSSHRIDPRGELRGRNNPHFLSPIRSISDSIYGRMGWRKEAFGMSISGY
jgi:hypothetical protein